MFEHQIDQMNYGWKGDITRKEGLVGHTSSLCGECALSTRLGEVSNTEFFREVAGTITKCPREASDKEF